MCNTTSWELIDMSPIATIERETKPIQYPSRKFETNDVPPPTRTDNVPQSKQRKWRTIELFQTVIDQQEEPETAWDSFSEFQQTLFSASPVYFTLKKLPRPSVIARSFEPHARQELLQLLLTRTSELRQNLGVPGVAIAIARLRSDLKNAYEEASHRDDLANVASLVSLLQDYCYTHWSRMSGEQLSKIENQLASLRIKQEISPKDLSRFSDALREQAMHIEYPSTEQLFLADEDSSNEQEDQDIED